MPERALLSQLGQIMAHLPGRISDALILAFFVKLPRPEIAKVLGIKDDRVQKLIAKGVKKLQDSVLASVGSKVENQDQVVEKLESLLESSAATFHPDPAWLSELRIKIALNRPVQPKGTFFQPAGPAFVRDFHLPQVTVWSLRLIPVVLVLAIAIFFGFRNQPNFFGRILPSGSFFNVFQTATKTTSWNQAPLEPVSIYNSAASGEPASIPAAGILTPPDETICRHGQEILGEDFPVQASLVTSTAYLNPSALPSDPEARGFGCQNEIIGGTPQVFSSPDVVLTTVQARFEKDGFEVINYVQCDDCQQNKKTQTVNFWGDAVSGSAVVMQKESLHAILSFTWQPTDSYVCSPGDTCQVPINQRQYTLRLNLATSAVGSTLSNFLNLWMRGDSAALKSLSSELLKQTHNIKAMDRSAGFSRTPLDSLQFIWKVVENQGGHLRFSLQGKLNESQAFIFSVEMISANGQWQVSSITPGIPFPPSTDFIYWSGQDGTIYRYSLAHGTIQAITSPGTYNPGIESPSRGAPDPPEVSPDGRWLVVHQAPTSKGQPGTLFVDLQNPGRVVYIRDAIRLAWSLDSSQIAWYQMTDPHHVFTLAAPFQGQPVDITAYLPEELVDLAWSPDGKQIAVLTLGPTLSSKSSSDSRTISLRQLDLAMIHLPSGDVKELAALTADINLDPQPGDLMWTADSQEIWDGALQTAVDATSGDAYPLVLNSQSGISLQPAITILSSKMTDDPTSPDNQWIANFQEQNSSIFMLPMGEEDQPRWSIYLDQTASLAWTAESKNLVIGNGLHQPGSIYRVNALTGESLALAQDMYWIGVGSRLQARSLQVAPQAPIDILQAGPSEDWQCQRFISELGCIPIPADWNLTGDKNGGWLLSNFNIESGQVWASLSKDAIMINLSFEPGTDLLQPYPPDQEGLSWEPVAGYATIGMHILPRKDTPFKNLVLFKTSTGVFSLDIFFGYPNPLVLQIMRSIQVLP